MGFLESVPRLSRVRIEEGLMLPNRCQATCFRFLGSAGMFPGPSGRFLPDTPFQSADRRYLKLLADLPCQPIVDLCVTRYWNSRAVGGIGIY
jgi:hypothetical protein